MTALIRLDAGHAVLAWCTACPSWRELRADRAAAWRAGADHAALVHGDAKAAAKAREQAARLAATRRA